MRLGTCPHQWEERSEQAQSLSSFHRSHCTARGPGGLGWWGDRGQQQPGLPEPSPRHRAAYRTETDFLTVLEATHHPEVGRYFYGAWYTNSGTAVSSMLQRPAGPGEDKAQAQLTPKPGASQSAKGSKRVGRLQCRDLGQFPTFVEERGLGLAGDSPWVKGNQLQGLGTLRMVECGSGYLGPGPGRQLPAPAVYELLIYPKI